LYGRDETIQQLEQIGFTQTQAKIYLALVNIGETDAKTLANVAKTSNQVTYRALTELQTRGIVEKKINLPSRYEAIPVDCALELILTEKRKEYNSTVERTKNILRNFETKNKIESPKQELSISIIEGRQTILNRCKLAHSNVQKTVLCCSTFQRWIQVGQEIHESIHKSLMRGAKYRTVIEKSTKKMSVPKEFNSLLSHPNFQVRIARQRLKLNAVVFDAKLASFNFYPSQSLAEAPMIWTNHPSIIVGFEYHFWNQWRNSQKMEYFSQ
jgi:sugar-specific transcriptional regulator TrmB